MNNAIISIKPQHVENIKKGWKTKELRTRPIKMETGTRLWIYTSGTKRQVEVVATVGFVSRGSTEAAWRHCKDELCIPKEYFDKYTQGREEVTIIQLDHVRILDYPLTLNYLRSMDPAFKAPQFYSKLKEGSRALDFLMCEYELSKLKALEATQTTCQPV